jgi:hypothetical protein
MGALPTWMSSVSQPAAANGANACLRCKVHDVGPAIVQYAMDGHP